MPDTFLALELEHLAALGSIILIDIVMSGDNAIVIGLAVAGLPPAMQRRAIVIGILLVMILRIAFALVVVELLGIVGLLLAGGILLLWVCWRMWRDIGHMRKPSGSNENIKARVDNARPATMRKALAVIIVADVSMSLDNVLAVGGAAQGHHGLLIFGLALSIALMAFAANVIAGLLRRHIWIAYVGLAVIAYVSLDMIWRGTREVLTVANLT